ncbi:MAG: endolytic transglycosylase MltG [Alphaproteobacteria bacterium]
MNTGIGKVITLGSVAALALGVCLYWLLLAAPGGESATRTFILPLGTPPETALAELERQGHIKSAWAFGLVHSARVAPGAYRLASDMDAFTVARRLAAEPQMKWVVIPEGWRKEQIAELLAATLDWSEREKLDWLTVATARNREEIEGVYFPDTYLIPADEDAEQVAKRLRARFHEKFAPHAEEALKQNIKWTSLLTIASLIQREAAGKADMPLIAGILWNRLLQDHKLDVDATVQYARDTDQSYGIEPCGTPADPARPAAATDCDGAALAPAAGAYLGMAAWWAPITIDDKRNDSRFNTYRHRKLPPHPIANPGLAAIEAALFPQKTECFYYLHAPNGDIHCAATYPEHLNNIERFL